MRAPDPSPPKKFLTADKRNLGTCWPSALVVVETDTDEGTEYMYVCTYIKYMQLEYIGTCPVGKEGAIYNSRKSIARLSED
jgi:hypothetical protein